MIAAMTTGNPSLDVFRAVSDPTRRQILDLLTEGERAVRDLITAFSMTQPAISQHLKILREAGLVEDRREGRLRIYSLRPEPLRAIYDWAQHFEQFWDERLDELGDYLDRESEAP